MRARTKKIVDIRVSLKDVKLLKKGYRVYKLVDGQSYCIMNKADRKIQRTIDKLKARIKELEQRKIVTK